MDFFNKYFKFVGSNTESPVTYHRWATITAIGAILEKNYYLPFGHSKINPNLYTMLIGNPGTRKSSAIKLITNLVIESGYTNIAADKTTKEKFLTDLSEINKSDADSFTSFLDGELYTGDPASVLISADEFNDFAGTGNLEFYALLGSLWDINKDYKYMTKTGEVIIPDPAISLLGGNTPIGFASAFPSEIIGQGFFSRLLLIYGEPTGKKIAFPEEPDPKAKAEIIKFLMAIRANVRGKAEIAADARLALEHIYENYTGVIDPRFESYTNRRFNQLVKLCLIHSAARLSKTISLEDVILSNTILTFTENFMPKALGEFGKAKHADATHKIMVALDSTIEPLSLQDLWKFVINDLDNLTELATIIRNLAEADKIHRVDERGFLPKKKINHNLNGKYFDYSLLTPEEQALSY